MLGTSCPPSLMQWRSTSWVELELLFSFRFQILAVESPELNRIPTRQDYSKGRLVSHGSYEVTYLRKKNNGLSIQRETEMCFSGDGQTHPEASRSLTGFQAQMNTSDSWPRSTVALLAGISTSTSISMGSLWLSEGSGCARTDAQIHAHHLLWRRISTCTQVDVVAHRG